MTVNTQAASIAAMAASISALNSSIAANKQKTKPIKPDSWLAILYVTASVACMVLVVVLLLQMVNLK